MSRAGARRRGSTSDIQRIRSLPEFHLQERVRGPQAPKRHGLPFRGNFYSAGGAYEPVAKLSRNQIVRGPGSIFEERTPNQIFAEQVSIMIVESVHIEIDELSPKRYRYPSSYPFSSSEWKLGLALKRAKKGSPLTKLPEKPVR